MTLSEFQKNYEVLPPEAQQQVIDFVAFMKEQYAKAAKQSGHFVICVKNEGYEASLELRKLYECLPDESSAKLSMVRVVDESGEDYLYPDTFFVPISLPQGVEERAVLAA